jgi:hypothetical protein
MSEERRICAAKPIKPVARSTGFETQPFEFAARPADDIEVNPLKGRTQLRSVEVAVVVDPASNARVTSRPDLAGICRCYDEASSAGSFG